MIPAAIARDALRSPQTECEDGVATSAWKPRAARQLLAVQIRAVPGAQCVVFSSRIPIDGDIVIGILGARFVAGVLADLGGWRVVYLTSAVLTLAMVGLLWRILPRNLSPDSTDSYAATLSSIPVLFLSDPILLIRGILALLIFAAFSTFWTALVLPLSAEPFVYSHMQIGLFGLVGMAGALAAAGAGRLADRGLGQ